MELWKKREIVVKEGLRTLWFWLLFSVGCALLYWGLGGLSAGAAFYYSFKVATLASVGYAPATAFVLAVSVIQSIVSYFVLVILVVTMGLAMAVLIEIKTGGRKP